MTYNLVESVFRDDCIDLPEGVIVISVKDFSIIYRDDGSVKVKEVIISYLRR